MARWTDEENELLISLREKPTTEIADNFPGRNYSAINAQREKLGVGYFQTTGDPTESSRNQWTAEEEINLIKNVLYKIPFDSRSEKSKRHRMTKIRNTIKDLKESGLSFEEIAKRTGYPKVLVEEVYATLRRPWTDREIDFLHENKNLSLSELAKQLNRTEESVRTKLSRENLLTKPEPWTDEENNFLLNHPNLTSEEISKKLSGRTVSAVRTQRTKLGTGKKRPGWTDEETQILKNNINLSAKELEKLLPGKNKDAINSKKRRLRKE